MEREVPEATKTTAEIKQEVLSGLAGLRLRLIEDGADIKHRPSDTDPVQRAECNLAFVMSAVSPIVLEYFYRSWKGLNFGSKLQILTGESLQYVVRADENKAEGKVILPSHTSPDVLYGSIKYLPIELTYRTLEDLWQNNSHRRAIASFGNLSREQILQKFERVIR